jgi:hypothetical protein
MGKARKILALVTGVGAASCTSPAAPAGPMSADLLRPVVLALSRGVVSRPLTAPDGRPTCGNLLRKGYRPPECT